MERKQQMDFFFEGSKFYESATKSNQINKRNIILNAFEKSYSHKNKIEKSNRKEV